MKYKSAASVLNDPYRAGCEIGRSLREISPEVVILFASITFEEGYADLYEGLADCLGDESFTLVGGSGDGIYASGKTSHFGVCALGMRPTDDASFGVAVKTGIGCDPQGVGRECADAALELLGSRPDWGFILADGITADGTTVVSGVLEAVSCPFVGGLTGDDRKFRKARIFYNRQILEDAVMVLLSSGGVPFLANSASGFMPVGGSGIIEEACGREIFRLSGQTPLEFIREQTGRPLGNTDFGILALAAEVAASEEQLMMRVMLGHNRTSGSIIMAGSIPVGSVVSVSGASRAEMLKAARGCAESLAAFGFKPAAAIVISCVGRKWQFCSCGEEEVQAIQEVIGSEVPLIGFPSFGEIGPFLGNHGSMSPSCFHNATCVICLLGE